MDNKYDQFIGGQFVWFTGVVEDINDPLEMGRVRVRCFGFHSEKKKNIATEELPWALVMTSTTNAAMEHIGRSATGILQGTWVVGFFRDGRSAQDPLVIGTIPSQTNKRDNPSKNGFCDPDGKYPKKNEEADIPLQASLRFSEAESYKKKSELTEETTNTALGGPEWTPPSTENTNKPVYPKNHVWESESGHSFEVDDTIESERISEFHRTGTFKEIDADGNKTVIVNGNNYQITIKDNDVRVKGSCYLTIDGEARTLIEGDHYIEVKGNYYKKIHGNEETEILKNESKTIGENNIVSIGGFENVNVASTYNHTSGGNTNITGSEIHLND